MRVFRFFGQKLGRNVHLHGVFKGLRNPAGKSGNSAKDIDSSALYAVLVHEGDIAVLHLNGHWNQYGVAGHSDEVSTNIEWHQINADLMADNFFQVLELDGWRLVQLGPLFQTIELLGLLIITERTGTKAFQTTIESIRLAGHSHLLVLGQAAVGCHQQCVLFRTVHSHVVVAAHARVHEFDDHFLANAFKVAVAPLFKRERGSRASALFHGTFVLSARGMGLNLIGLSIHDVHPAAIAFPARNASGKVLVGISNTRVVLFFELVFYRIRRWIAALPEAFNELVPFFVIRKLFECCPLFIADNPAHIFIQPLFIGLA